MYFIRNFVRSFHPSSDIISFKNLGSEQKSRSFLTWCQLGANLVPTWCQLSAYLLPKGIVVLLKFLRLFLLYLLLLMDLDFNKLNLELKPRFMPS